MLIMCIWIQALYNTDIIIHWTLIYCITKYIMIYIFFVTVCVQVLVAHTKAEVFEMVRDLDLPLEQGNILLLKKLQALGLHANR